jgi:hypothetical protein
LCQMFQIFFHLPLSEEALPQFHLFQALLLDLVVAMYTDIWSVFGHSVITKVSFVYHSLINYGAHYLLLSGCGKAFVSRSTRFFTDS